MKGKHAVRAALVAAYVCSMAHGTTKTGEEVFAKWLRVQKVLCDRPPQAFAAHMQAFHGTSHIQSKYAKYQKVLSQYNPFLKTCGLEQCAQSGQWNVQTLQPFYTWFDHDMGQFFSYLMQAHFIDQTVNAQEQDMDIDSVIKRHRSLMKLFFCDCDKIVRLEYLFSVSNRMFEYCFGNQRSFSQFKRFLYDDSLHQIARLCYSTMWFYLVGEGWKHWSNECLSKIKKEADRGKEIVYIAGGNDIYQLLNHGIYSIRVIDPMLPSQPRYYSEGWDWLLKPAQGNGIGDCVILRCDNQKLCLKRETYNEMGTFKANLSTGATTKLPLSVTRWGVYDQANTKLGSIVFDRRYCRTKDFYIHPKKTLLISFNEMYFAAMPDKLFGWGINVAALSGKMQLYVKQLRKPVNKRVLLTFRRNEAKAPFDFILLGSCAT